MLIGLATFVPIIVILNGIDTALLEPVRHCVPTMLVRGPSHVCICTSEGIFHCRPKKFEEDEALTADVAIARKLPEIKYGMKCVQGQTYKMACNTCRCGNKNNLVCTKVLCIHDVNEEINGDSDSDTQPTKTNSSSAKVKKKRIRRIIRRENNRYLRTDTTGFPNLPPNKVCVPGKIYQDNCRRCYCRANRTPTCSNEDACKQPIVARDLKPEDVRSPIKDKEFMNLPELPHTASPCVPGTTYKIDCNVCLCDEFQNLMCDKLLCISFADMHKAEAIKKSGLPCNNKDFTENMVLQSKCVECTCNGTTYCVAKDNCISEAESLQRAHGSRRSFDINSGQCLPNHVYKDDCNKCYCQENQSLRCTQKKCLNYTEAVEMQKHQEYLLRHRL